MLLNIYQDILKWQGLWPHWRHSIMDSCTGNSVFMFQSPIIFWFSIWGRIHCMSQDRKLTKRIRPGAQRSLWICRKLTRSIQTNRGRSNTSYRIMMTTTGLLKQLTSYPELIVKETLLLNWIRIQRSQYWHSPTNIDETLEIYSARYLQACAISAQLSWF